MFITQNTIEQKQEQYLIDDHLLQSDVAVCQIPMCAWCLSDQGITATEGSHGICAGHAEWLLKQWKEQRHRRVTARR